MIYELFISLVTIRFTLIGHLTYQASHGEIALFSDVHVLLYL